MKTVQISFDTDTLAKVKSFVNEVTKFDNEFDLVSGRYVVDAKSIMVSSVWNLTKPITLNIHTDENVDKILDTLKDYLI